MDTSVLPVLIHFSHPLTIFCFYTFLFIRYEKYILTVPKESRLYEERLGRHPLTPPYHLQMSNRKFKGLIDQWRGLLHGWDGDGEGFSSKDEMKHTRNARHIQQLVEEQHHRASSSPLTPDQPTSFPDQSAEDEADAEAMRIAAELTESLG